MKGDIIREIFKGDHNAAARKLTRNQISALSGMFNYHPDKHTPLKTCFWSCDFSDWLKCHDTIFKFFSQGYCIHVLNLKRIHPVVTEL